MSRRDIAKLAFVLAGIYGLFEALPHTKTLVFLLVAQPQMFSDWAPGMSRSQVILWSALPLLLLTVGGVGLMVFSGRLAARMFPDAPYDPERILAFPALAYSVVGLVCFAWGLSTLATSVLGAVNSGWEGAPGLVESSVLILMGVYLFNGSHGLARIWSRLRYSGLRRQMGLCIRCGYDLTGNTTGVCPECGTDQVLPSSSSRDL